jgi:glycosyltransferase involved in cell wall biosynthesis
VRVLQLLVSTALGGGPRQVWDLVRRLPREEFEVVVAGPRDGVFFERFQGLGIQTLPLPLDRLGPAGLRGTIRLLREGKIDLVHSHGKGAGLHGRLAARWSGVPAVHTFHGIHYRYPAPARQLYLALERGLGRLSHTVIHVSASQEAEAQSLGLAAPGRSVTIVNGIDVPELDASLARSPITREKLGLGREHLVLGCVARFDPVKRLDVLVRALRHLVAREPRARLVLVGGGEAEPRLRQLVRATGLGDHVVFAGWLEEAARVCPALDLSVSASLKEGLPLSLVEAMAARLAVVASDVPGHRDVVAGGETGVLVPPENPEALAAAAASLLADPERRRRLGEAGRARVLRDFSAEAMVRQTADVYRRAASAGRPRPTPGR